MTTQEVALPQYPEVFISYQGGALRNGFFSHLEWALKRNGVNVYHDQGLLPGVPIENIFKVIEESRIALVIFSSRYIESRMCLEELVKIKERVEEGKLVAIPVFYKLNPSEVKFLEGKFGDNFWDLAKVSSLDKLKEWKEALLLVTRMVGFVFNEKRDNVAKFINSIAVAVKNVIEKSHEQQEDASMDDPSSDDLKGVDGEIDGILLDTKTYRSPKEAEIVHAEAKSRRDVGLNPSKVIIVFYKQMVSKVKMFYEIFGDNFRDLAKVYSLDKIEKWRKALKFISRTIGFVFDEMSDNEANFINKIVEQVKIEIRNSDRNPKEVEIVQPEEKSRRDDNFLGETNSSFTVIKLPPNHQMLRYGFLSHLVKVLESYKITSQLGMIIGCLLLLFFCHQHIAYMSTPLSGESGRVVENLPKVLEYIPAEQTEIPRDKFNENLCKEICTNSPMDGKAKPPNIQVFINFRGDQLRNNFVGYLVAVLQGSGINVFIENHEQRGEGLNTLFKRIEDSGIAIVVFSSRYTESNWCLDELVKIKERVHQGLLKVLPIFYKVTPGNVKRLKGEFGDNFRDKEYIFASDEPMIKRWKEAIVFVSHKFALTLDEKSVLEIDFIETIVKEVLKMLQAISKVESGQSSS